MRVLIVDNDSDYCSTLGSILATRGHDVSSCATTSAAVAALMGAKFDAVVLDLHFADDTAETVLPVATGPNGARLVIMCSGSRAAAAVAQRWSVKFIPKPFNPDALLDCLASVGAR